MAHYQTQHGASPQDTDEYGNPIQQVNTGGFGTATTGTGYRTTDAPYTGGQQQQEGGMMDKIPGTGGGRRDDDPYSAHAYTGTGKSGMTGTGYGTTDAPYTGGESKERGMMDKIKDKIPGTGRRDEAYSSQTTSTTTPYGGTTGEHQEKKGVMDKIKEKLPGGHH